MKVKYKLNPVWIIMGIIWTAISIFLYFKYIPDSEAEFSQIRMVTLVALPALVAIYYYLMPLINYCKVTDRNVAIHKSMIIFTYKIKREDLACCRVLGRDLVFYSHKNKDYAIHLDWSNKEQVIDLIKHLQSFTQVYDGNSKRSININDISTLA